MERLWLRRIRKSRERDDIRGQTVFEDYAEVHAPAREDEVLRSAAARARETARLVKEKRESLG
jgi:phosphohistidine phosphatase SixA